jgi:hypothetical protein
VVKEAELEVFKKKNPDTAKTYEQIGALKAQIQTSDTEKKKPQDEIAALKLKNAGNKVNPQPNKH